MTMKHTERELRRLGDPDLATIINGVHAVFEKRHPNLGDIPFPPKIDPAREAIVKQSLVNQDRKLRDAVRPFIEEYSAAKDHTPSLIDHTWQGIWKIIGDRVGYEYQVPACDRTEEELAKLREENRAVLLLPSDIYTPDGLVRLGRAFPLMDSWTTDPKWVEDILFVDNPNGGAIDIEMNTRTPYITSVGYNQRELVDKIEADGRRGQRLPTYFVGSQFSKLLTGEYFDTSTWSRLPGTFSLGDMLDAFFHSDGQVGVLSHWYQDFRSPNLGGRSEGVKRA